METDNESEDEIHCVAGFEEDGEEDPLAEVNFGPISLKEELGIFSTDTREQDKVIGSQAYENTSAGSEVFIKEEPPNMDNEPEDGIDGELGIGEDTPINAIWIEVKHEPEDEVTESQAFEGCSGMVEGISGALPHQCDICGRNFKYAYNLKMHMYSHTGERPFSCTVCKKSFGVKQYLVEHMWTHTGKKPFPCTVCKKRFIRKGKLINHMADHAGERRYPCTVCEKRFVLKQHLVQHMRTHLEEKPYPCTVCETRLCSKHSLIRHMLTHKGGKTSAGWN